MTEHTFDDPTRALLQKFGFEEANFERLRARLKSGQAGADSNRILGKVTPPAPEDVSDLPALGTEERKALTKIGETAIQRGEVGLIVLAGGMATRFGGVVKAIVPAIGDRTFLDLKLADGKAAAVAAGGEVPLYFMTSFATDAIISEQLAERQDPQCPARTFSQHISARLTPEAEVFLDDDQHPSLYATGHGDLPSALKRGGVLEEFKKRGGKYLMMTNVDNLTATLDAAIIGAHIKAAKPMTAEMAPKLPGDKGGAPARVDGVPQIVEGFRFPDDFDQDQIPVFNTNTLVFDVDALDQPFDLTWFAVTKKVNEKSVIQFERLVGQLSAAMPCQFLKVARSGEDARFQPVKDPAELTRRQDEITTALRARSILPAH